MKSLPVIFCSFLLLCQAAFAQSVPAPSHRVIIQISHANSLNTGVTINAPLVSIQLCEPGTQKCVTIPKIIVDTGSVGLRLFSAPVGLSLPRQKDQNGNVISENLHFAEGTCLWGPVVKGDLKLGTETIANLLVHVNIGTYPFSPSGCNYPVQSGDQFGFNGILGVASKKLDCPDGSDGDCASSTNRYYACNAQSCVGAAVTASQEVMNPIALNYNGFSISLPALSSGDSSQTVGSLILGDSEAVVTPDKKIVHTDSEGAFPAIFNGVTYPAVLDSGTAWNFLPGIDSGETCQMAKIEHPPLCPATLETQTIDLESIDQTGRFTTALKVGNYQDEIARGSVSSDNLTVSAPDPDHSSMVYLGMSFFYGKTIYFGFNQNVTPFGPGPLFAF